MYWKSLIVCLLLVSIVNSVYLYTGVVNVSSSSPLLYEILPDSYLSYKAIALNGEPIDLLVTRSKWVCGGLVTRYYPDLSCTDKIVCILERKQITLLPTTDTFYISLGSTRIENTTIDLYIESSTTPYIYAVVFVCLVFLGIVLVIAGALIAVYRMKNNRLA